MKGFFYSVIFLFLCIFFISVALNFIQINIKMNKDKDDLWKETFYYGSNKSYFRTLSEESEINLTLDGLYEFSNIKPDGTLESTYNQLNLELQKDIIYYLDTLKNNYRIAGALNEDSKTSDECPFYIYVSRNEKDDDEANTVKVGLCKRY